MHLEECQKGESEGPAAVQFYFTTGEAEAANDALATSLLQALKVTQRIAVRLAARRPAPAREEEPVDRD